jgi:hypothetical protein
MPIDRREDSVDHLRFATREAMVETGLHKASGFHQVGIRGAVIAFAAKNIRQTLEQSFV